MLFWDSADDNFRSYLNYAIKERLERLITMKERNGLDHNDLLRGLGINEKQLVQLMGYFAKLDALEKAVSKL